MASKGLNPILVAKQIKMRFQCASIFAAFALVTICDSFSVNFDRTSRFSSVNVAHFSSKATSRSSWKPTFGGDGQNVIRMADPDVPPEVDPTRRDPDEPGPDIPIRLPMVDFGGTKMDVNSRLLKDRIIMIGKQVDDNMANVVVAQLLYLANEDPKADITMYINSPGGSISSGMAIFDTMQFIPCDVSTVCFGMAASMGAFLLGAGTKGKRRSLPNARIMIHQPLGGARGQAADIEIQAKEILFVRAQINAYISEFTDQPVEKIEEDCDRDFYLTAAQAVDYGLIDEVVQTKTSHIKIPAMPQLL
jgi:ATP-dependent Clp protease, protease subunit